MFNCDDTVCCCASGRVIYKTALHWTLFCSSSVFPHTWTFLMSKNPSTDRQYRRRIRLKWSALSLSRRPEWKDVYLSWKFIQQMNSELLLFFLYFLNVPVHRASKYAANINQSAFNRSKLIQNCASSLVLILIRVITSFNLCFKRFLFLCLREKRQEPDITWTISRTQEPSLMRPDPSWLKSRWTICSLFHICPPSWQASWAATRVSFHPFSFDHELWRPKPRQTRGRACGRVTRRLLLSVCSFIIVIQWLSWKGKGSVLISSQAELLDL